MSTKNLPRIFWIGDSVALHYGPYLAQYLHGIAEIEVRQGYLEAIKNLDHPRGQNCGDSSMVLGFVEVLLRRPEFRPAWVFFNCGLHDIKTDPASGQRQIGPENYTKNLKKILRLILEAGKTPVWLTTTPVDDVRHRRYCPEVHRFRRDVDAYNEKAREVMETLGVVVFDLHGFTSRLEGELYKDHVHFTEPIRRLQAAYLAGRAQGLLQNEGTTT